MCTLSLRSRAGRHARPILAASLALAVAGFDAAADQKQYKFCNNTGQAASDLHIEFDKAVTFDGTPKQDPAGTFEDAKGSSSDVVDLANGFTGSGVSSGECVILTFEFDAGSKVPKVSKAQWTKGNTLDPKKNKKAELDDFLGEPLKEDPEVKNAWIEAEATGDGVLLVAIAGEPPMKFAPTAGDTGTQTAAKFAEFIGALPFGEVVCVDGASVVSTARVIGAGPAITIEVLEKDSTQAVEISPLATYATGFEAPWYKGAPEGVPLDPSTGWSIDGEPPLEQFALNYTHTVNEPGIERLPGGGEQFIAATAGKDGPGGAGRSAVFDGGCIPAYDAIWEFCYDTTGRFTGDVPPEGLADIFSRFTLEPTKDSRFFTQVGVWAGKKNGDSVSFGYQVAGAAPGSTVDQSVEGIRYAGPEWVDLDTDGWWGICHGVSFAQNRIVWVSIENYQTGERTQFEPADWYLDGGASPDKVLPTGVRFLAMGTPGVHAAWDNFTMDWAEPATPCYADFTADGSLDLFDFLQYVNAFNNGEKRADCDGDGVLTLFDFLCFVNAFNEGC